MTTLSTSMIGCNRQKMMLKTALLSSLFILSALLFLFILPKIGVTLWITLPFAIASLLYFGINGSLCLRHLVFQKPALIINQEGLFDNISLGSLGLIPWTEIRSIDEIAIAGRSYIRVQVLHPERYTEKAQSLFQLFVIKTNLRNYGGALHLDSNMLSTPHATLLQQLHYYHNVVGKSTL